MLTACVPSGSARRARFRITLLALATCAGMPARAQDASSAVYVRVDGDHTTVVTPRVHVGSSVADGTRVDLTYSADVWTSASIDIATSASKAVTEQRDELDLAAAQHPGDAQLTAAYRFSTEPDYKSHGVTLGGSYDLAQRSTTLGLSVSTLFDQVGRAGDPSFADNVKTLSLRASFTQLLDRNSWLQALYEPGYASGFLASPYRFVATGSGVPRCGDPNVVCVHESLPRERMRHAFALVYRRALSEQIALGVSDRVYVDGWSVLSDTAEFTFSVMPALATRLAVDYRFYAQSAARYYQATVPSLAAIGTYSTRDKELSPFISHALSFTLDQALPIGASGTLHMALLLGPSLYLFNDFPAYDHLWAFEITGAMRVEP